MGDECQDAQFRLMQKTGEEYVKGYEKEQQEKYPYESKYTGIERIKKRWPNSSQGILISIFVFMLLNYLII